MRSRTLILKIAVVASATAAMLGAGIAGVRAEPPDPLAPPSGIVSVSVDAPHPLAPPSGIVSPGYRPARAELLGSIESSRTTCTGRRSVSTTRQSHRRTSLPGTQAR